MPTGFVQLSWKPASGKEPVPIAGVAVCVDRLKDAAIRTLTLKAGDFADGLSVVDEVNVADGYVGWILLTPKDGGARNALASNLIRVELAGSNRMRLRGFVFFPTTFTLALTLPLSTLFVHQTYRPYSTRDGRCDDG